MNDVLRYFFTYFNYSKEKGFIFVIPISNSKEHLSVGFDNQRKEFNIHFTDDSIKIKGANRRDFVLKMSYFRFFLLVKRFEKVYQYSILRLIFSSKINPGKLKKHRLILYPLELSDKHKTNLLKISRKGRKMRFQQNIDYDLFWSGFIQVSEINMSKSSSFKVFKYRRGHMSMQGYLLRFEVLNGSLYFIPSKKLYRFQKNLLIYLYNYLNYYPTKETLPFRKQIYEKLILFKN